MKYSKIAVGIISASLLLPQISVTGLSAGQTDSFNSLILMERNFNSSDKLLDLNMDDHIDVMDLCRNKRNILYSISSVPVWLSTGNAEINYIDKTIRIPMYIHDVKNEISELSMDLAFDRSVFSIRNISAEGTAERMRTSENNGILTLTGDHETIRSDGLFAVITLAFSDDISGGNYIFGLENINAYIKNDYSDHYQLPPNRINRTTQDYFFYIDRNQIYIPVQTIVTTTPPVTTVTTTTTAPVTTPIPGVKADISDAERKAMDYVNVWRKNKGLSELSINEALCFCADIRADELKTYYSGYRPDGSDTDTLLIQYNAPGKYNSYEYYMCTSDPDEFYEVFSDYIETSPSYGSAASPTMKYVGIGMKNGYLYMIIAK